MSRIEEMVEEMCPVEYRKIGDVTVMKRGTSLTKKKAEEGNIPVIYGGRQPAFYCNQSNRGRRDHYRGWQRGRSRIRAVLE